MEKISIRRAWATGTARVRERWREMLAIAIVMTAAPALLNYLLPGNTAEALFSDASGAREILGLAGIGITSIVAVLLSTGGYMVAWRRLAKSGSNWGSVIAYGALATLAIIVVATVLIAGLALIMSVGMFGAITGVGTNDTSPVIVIVVMLAAIVGTIWLFARLIVTGPAMADIQTYSPFRGFAVSWRLTRSSQWKLVGFVVVLSLLSAVVSSIAGAAALVSGASLEDMIQPSLGLLLTSLVIQVPVVLLWIAVCEGLYREAHGAPDVAEIFA